MALSTREYYKKLEKFTQKPPKAQNCNVPWQPITMKYFHEFSSLIGYRQKARLTSRLILSYINQGQTALPQTASPVPKCIAVLGSRIDEILRLLQNISQISVC